MTGVTKHSIFISHASEDLAIASAVQKLLEQTLRPRPRERLVFRSTDIKAIEGGADWYAEIIKALQGARVCLSLFTPVSVHKPWVMYESGGAYAIFRNKPGRLIPVCALGITPELVPGPLKRLLARRLYDPVELEELLRQLAQLIDTRFSRSSRMINAVARLGKDSTGGWESVQVSRVATRADLSPYRFDKALAAARNWVFVAGQSLYSIASSEVHRKLILQFLSSGRGRRVDLLICDSRNKSAVRAWSEVNPEQPLVGYTHEDHLRSAEAEFGSLIREARRRKLALRVRVLGLVPFGATAIDPASTDGVIAFQPIVNHGQKSSERPMFLLTKTGNPEVFRYYWLNLQTAFNCGEDLERALKRRSNSRRNGRAVTAARNQASVPARRSPRR